MQQQDNDHHETIILLYVILYLDWLQHFNLLQLSNWRPPFHSLNILYRTVAKRYLRSSVTKFTTNQPQPQLNHDELSTRFSLRWLLTQQYTTFCLTMDVKYIATAGTRGHAKFAFIKAKCCPKLFWKIYVQIGKKHEQYTQQSTIKLFESAPHPPRVCSIQRQYHRCNGQQWQSVILIW